MYFAVFLLFCGVITALPYDPVIRKLQPGLRYNYVQSPDGIRLVDTWLKVSDLAVTARYDPDTQNAYHLFTRQNPTISQPIVLGNAGGLSSTNYDVNKKTVVLIHGWMDSASANFNAVLVPAFLTAVDANIIVVDWWAGAGTWDFGAAALNTVSSGQGVARFVSWLVQTTGGSLSDFHIAGFSLGGQQSGVVGRNLNGEVAYITALDPAGGWRDNPEGFRSTDGIYTEVIHTSPVGELKPVGDVDFYPNGGVTMPGCNLDMSCGHDRCYYFMAESLTSGGFTGTRCDNYLSAMLGNCDDSEILHMGGPVPKTGRSGIFYLETNAGPPFSRG